MSLHAIDGSSHTQTSYLDVISKDIGVQLTYFSSVLSQL